MSKNEIIEKVKKILAKADESRNASEHEVQAAAEMARRMMARYNLSLADVELDSDEVKFHEEIRIMHAEAGETGVAFQFEHMINHAVAKITNTEYFLNRRRAYNPGRKASTVTKMIFAGTEVDVAVAVELSRYLLRKVRELSKVEVGGGVTVARRSWCEGFGNRVLERARESVIVKREVMDENGTITEQDPDMSEADARKYALVIAGKEEKLADYLRAAGVRAGKSKSRRVSYDREAYARGREAGSRVDLGRNRLGGN